MSCGAARGRVWTTGTSSTSWCVSRHVSASRSGSSRSRRRPRAAEAAASSRVASSSSWTRRAPLGDRVSALASALSDLDLDDVYVTPEARDRVEGARDARVRPREGVAARPAHHAGRRRPGALVRRGARRGDGPRGAPRGRRRAGSRSASSAAAPTWSSPTRASTRSSSGSPSAASPRERRRPRSSSPRRPASRGTTSSGYAVERGWAGLECLSGIPGLVGATPIQNVGAYGQEVSDTIAAVRALDRATRTSRDARAARRAGSATATARSRAATPDRHVVLAVTYRLRPGGAPRSATPSSSGTWPRAGSRRRRSRTCGRACSPCAASKSMVLDAAAIPNRRSCGSFFVNPVVPAAEAERIASRRGRSRHAAVAASRDGRG